MTARQFIRVSWRSGSRGVDRPAIADQTLFDVELASLEHLPLALSGPADDEAQNSVVARRSGDVAQPGLDLLGGAVHSQKPPVSGATTLENSRVSLHRTELVWRSITVRAAT